MKKRWLLILGLLAFVITGVLHAPADRLYAWASAQQERPSLQLYGVQGQLAQGKATRVTLDQRTLLNDLQWKLQPAWLLLLRVSAVFESKQTLDLHVKASRSVFGRTRLDDMHLSGNVADVLAMATPVRLPLQGSAHLAVDSARLEQGLPVQIDGLAELQDLTWTLAKDPLVLGSYNANLTTDEGGVLAQLASGEAPLELSGEARLAPDRTWELRVQIKPRPDASPELLALIRSLGQPDNGGWYHLRRNGQL